MSGNPLDQVVNFYVCNGGEGRCGTRDDKTNTYERLQERLAARADEFNSRGLSTHAEQKICLGRMFCGAGNRVDVVRSGENGFDAMYGARDLEVDGTRVHSAKRADALIDDVLSRADKVSSE